MANLVTSLREMCRAGTADYSLGTVAYWSDDQLQTILDRYSRKVIDEPLQVTPDNINGTASFTFYQSKNRFMESTSSGTAIFIIRDSLGSAVASGYTPNYENGQITFTNNTLGTAYYLTANSFDIYAAAADVWRSKAADAAYAIDFSTDNHTIKRSHIAKLALMMADRYEAMADSPIKETPHVERLDYA